MRCPQKLEKAGTQSPQELPVGASPAHSWETHVRLRTSQSQSVSVSLWSRSQQPQGTPEVVAFVRPAVLRARHAQPQGPLPSGTTSLVACWGAQPTAQWAWNPRARSAALENGHTSSGPRLYVPASQGQEITEGVMAVTIWSAQGRGLPGEPGMSWSACRGSGPGPWPSPPLPTAPHVQCCSPALSAGTAQAVLSSCLRPPHIPCFSRGSTGPK